MREDIEFLKCKIELLEAELIDSDSKWDKERSLVELICLKLEETERMWRKEKSRAEWWRKQSLRRRHEILDNMPPVRILTRDEISQVDYQPPYKAKRVYMYDLR